MFEPVLYYRSLHYSSAPLHVRQNNPRCSLCRFRLLESDTIYLHGNNHAIHELCAAEWHKVNTTCYQCRRAICPTPLSEKACKLMDGFQRLEKNVSLVIEFSIVILSTVFNAVGLHAADQVAIFIPE